MHDPFDHVLAALLLAAQPIWSALRGARELEAMKDPACRRKSYLWTIAMQWSYAAALLALWIWADREWTPLGLGLSLGWGLAAGALICLALVVLMQRQLSRVARDPQLRSQVLAEAQDLEGLLPVTPADVHLSRTLSLTAGVCEELAYRGFLLWYFGAWFSLWLAVPLSALAFGAAHLYQGPRKAGRIVGVGLASALLYVLTGSLWLPMALHAFVDLNMLKLMRVALLSDEPGGPFGAVEP